MELRIKFLSDLAVTPRVAHEGDAGMDVFPQGDFMIPCRGRKLVKLGFSLVIPLGYEVQVRPRSGLALKHGVTVLNSPGTIDSSYVGEVGVILINHGESPYYGSPEQAIAQLVVAPVESVSLTVVEEFKKETTRGIYGFGSTDTARFELS